MPENNEIVQLRGHHIFCYELWPSVSAGRGDAFARQRQLVQAALRSETAVLRIVEGVDCLCATCSHCKNGRCESPKGGDEGVRKWDGILVRELGITFGTTMPAPQWRALIASKKPYQLCVRCSYRSRCGAAKPRATPG